MNNLLFLSKPARLILVLTGALIAGSFIYPFYSHVFTPFLSSYSNYRAGLAYAWTDLWYETFRSATVIGIILMGGFLIAFGLSTRLQKRINFGRMVIFFIALIFVAGLLGIVGYALRSLYCPPDQRLGFLTRPYFWTILFDMFLMAWALTLGFAIFLQPALKSNRLWAGIMNIMPVVWAPAYALFKWFTRFCVDPWPVLIIGIACCLIGFPVIRTGVTIANLLVPDYRQPANRKINQEEKPQPSHWTRLSGALILVAGAGMIVTAAVAAGYCGAAK